MSPDFSSKPRPQTSRLESALLLGGILALVAASVSLWGAKQEQREIQEATTRARAGAEGSQARLRLLESHKETGPAQMLVAQASDTAESPPPRVLADLGALLPPDVRLESVSLTYGERLSVEMHVVARRPSSYDRLLERMAESPRFGELTTGPEDREGEMRTSLRAVYRPEAGR